MHEHLWPHRSLFVLRWNEQQPRWAHITRIPADSGYPPMPLGWVRLNADAVFEKLAWEYSIPRPDGIREVWVTGCVHYPPSPEDPHR